MSNGSEILHPAKYCFAIVTDPAKPKKVIYAGQSAGDAAGDYTVGKKNIVSLYNKHLSGMVEAKYIPFMNALNIAFQTGRYDDARRHLKAAKDMPGRADHALAAYEDVLAP